MSETSPRNPSDARIDADTSVTTIIVHRPLKARVAAYESWLTEIVPIAQTFAGHRGVNIIRPSGGGEDYTIVLHFDSETRLRGWLDSETRKQLVEKVRPFLNAEEKIDIKPGIEFWFTPPDARKVAPAYKQFLVTLSAIFPLVVIVPWSLSPVFAWAPVLGVVGIRQFIVASVIVAIMTFWLMPRYIRRISGWLYR
jgi:uncharacterized protein